MTIEQSLAKREEVQSLATKVALDVLLDKGKAGLVIGTGVGKTKIAIDIVKGLLASESYPDPSRKILILVPSERLRDNDWIKGLDKFGLSRENVVLECYQTAYKWVDTHWWAVIADEQDFSLTPEYSAFYLNNAKHFLIGMTGFVTDEKKELMMSLNPICFEYSTQDAQRDGILNPTKFYEVRFPVGHLKTIPVRFKKNGVEREFRQSENAAYEYFHKNYSKALMEFRVNEKDRRAAELVIESLANKADKDAAEWIETKEKLIKATKASDAAFGKMKKWAGKRKTLIHTLESSAKVAKELIRVIHQQPGNKVLVFSALTEQADKICEHTYHSKNKDLNKIQLLSDGKINTCGVCQAVNRGVNLDEVNVLIKESYVGSETDFQQQHGRGVRLRPDQTMYFIVLVPYFWTRVNELNPKTLKEEEKWVMLPTVAADWAANMTASFKYNPEVIHMVHNTRNDTYTLPNYVNFCKSS